MLHPSEDLRVLMINPYSRTAVGLVSSLWAPSTPAENSEREHKPGPVPRILTRALPIFDSDIHQTDLSAIKVTALPRCLQQKS